MPNQASFQQQQQFDLNDDNFDLVSLASTNSTPSSSLLINANQNGIINDTDMLNGNKMQSNGIVPRMNPLVSMDNHPGAGMNKNNVNTNAGLLSIQSSNSLISSSASSLSSSSSVSSHSGSLSQDDIQFNEFTNQTSHLKHHSHHHHHHPHHHHPYLTQHHLNQHQSHPNHFQHSSNTNSSSQEGIQLSIQNLNTLKSISDYQQKVEYLLKLTPIPSNWQKSQTETGEIFFINHTTRSTCWDPRLKIVENYLQKHEQALHQQQQQLHQHHDSDFNSLHPMTNQSIPMYQQQMNSRSNSTGAVSSSSCTSSNSASPLFMLNSSGSGASNILINSNNNSVSATSNEIMGIENGLMQQQQHQQHHQKLEEFPALLEARGESYQHQERINTLIDIITKKKELIKSLNELNKKVKIFLLIVKIFFISK